MNQSHTSSGTEVTRKRSWMMTFSDILLQLLAFFIMRLAITPYRFNAVLPPAQTKPAGATAEQPEKKMQQLHFLKFHRMDSPDSIEAELGTQYLPESREDISFALREELVTLGTTFGGGDYLISISGTQCKDSEKVSAASSFLIGELLANGVPRQCLQLGNKGKSLEPCATESADGPKLSGLTISISQRRCDPFA